jgi:predicted amidohydrolase
LVGEYSKTHLISAMGEDAVYQPGAGRLTVRIGELRVSFFICYDLRFPTLFYDRAESTDLFVVVANWPAPRQRHWETLLAARAIENQAYVAGVNRVGQGGGYEFTGGSRVISPQGDVLATCHAREQVKVVELQLDAVASWRQQFGCLRDRR